MKLIPKRKRDRNGCGVVCGVDIDFFRVLPWAVTNEEIEVGSFINKALWTHRLATITEKSERVIQELTVFTGTSSVPVNSTR